MSHQPRLRWAFILVIALILTSCKQSLTQTPATTATESLPQPTPEQPTLIASTPAPSGSNAARLIFTKEFDTLNPIYSTLWQATITHQIWNCWAWDFDEQNNPVPVLVKEIPSLENGGLSQDGKTITMHLRDDIVWSDGSPITSADFAFTFQMVISPQNSVATGDLYEKVQSVQAPDERTVVIAFAEPYIAWLSTLWHGLLPEHILKPVFDEKGSLDAAEWNSAPSVGCGPFVFQEWKKGEFARFTANEKYWLGRPKLDEVTIRFVADDAAQAAALKAGEADLGALIPFSEAPDLEAAGLKVIRMFSGYNEGWFFYLDPANGHPALQDVRVRKAIAMALDRPSMISNLLKGQTQPAVSYWDNTPYVDPSLQPWPYDPEGAKKLLDEAGWVDSNGDSVRDKDGIDLLLAFGTTDKEIRKSAQELAVQQLAAVGIKLSPTNYSDEIFFSSFGSGGPTATGQLDIFEYAPRPNFPDPDTSDFRCDQIPSADKPNGMNWSAFCDQELDQLFQLESTQVDFQARQQTFYQISKLIYDKVYFLGLWQDPDLWGVSTRLANISISGTTPFYNIHAWEITP